MKKIVIAIFVGAVIMTFFIIAKNNSHQTATAETNNQIQEGQGQSTKGKAEKIEVVHFHATQQCWSCMTVGGYALKTIKEKFSEEYKNGTIVFKDINGELPENRDIVMKYQARGSSLFVNAIKNGQDNIEEDVKVWRLVTNENQFISYFEDKLKNLLGR